MPAMGEYYKRPEEIKFLQPKESPEPVPEGKVEEAYKLPGLFDSVKLESKTVGGTFFRFPSPADIALWHSRIPTNVLEMRDAKAGTDHNEGVRNLIYWINQGVSALEEAQRHAPEEELLKDLFPEYDGKAVEHNLGKARAAFKNAQTISEQLGKRYYPRLYNKGSDSWISNPFKHQEGEPTILTAEGPDIKELEKQLRSDEYEQTALGSKDTREQYAEKIRLRRRGIELAKHIKITCDVEQPRGFETIKVSADVPEYYSGPLRVTFTIEEDGHNRVVETTGTFSYVNKDRSQLGTAEEPATPTAERPDYVMRPGLRELPWWEGDASEDARLKNILALGLFVEAVKKGESIHTQ